MGRLALATVVLVACQQAPGDDRPDRDAADADTDSDADADSDTDADTDGDPALAATCALQPDNALRVDCAITVAPPGPVEVRFAPSAGGETRVAVSSAVAAEHLVTLWRMHAETTYDWTASGGGLEVSGTFTTGALPTAAQVGGTLSGSTTATEDLLLLHGCEGPHAVAIDAAGRPVWYQALAADLPSSSAQALVFTPDREIATIVDQQRVRRFALDGRMRMDAVPAGGKPLHHDLFVRDGLTWVLNAAAYEAGGEQYVLDGLYVLDDLGAVVGEWELASVLTPFGGERGSAYWDPVFPGAIDWSHGNGVFVDEVHDVYLSFYGLDAVLKLAGDPGDPAFGAVRWVLAGSDRPFPPSDFAIVDPADLTDDLTFHQHHPTLLASGELQLFDNGTGGDSRVLRFALDEAGGEALVTGSWPVPATCPIGGSAFSLSNGNVLATCATGPAIHEIEPATGAIVRTVAPTCWNGFSLPFPRAIPVTL